MDIVFNQRLRRGWPRKMIGASALLLAAVAASCKEPGYRTEVYPGQQGQYTVARIPETPRPADSSASVQANAKTPTPPASVNPAPAPTPSAAALPSSVPADENLGQVEAIWPKLSDSDRALLVETAKHLAAQH